MLLCGLEGAQQTVWVANSVAAARLETPSLV
jgi:hypothetical protein